MLWRPVTLVADGGRDKQMAAETMPARRGPWLPSEFSERGGATPKGLARYTLRVVQSKHGHSPPKSSVRSCLNLARGDASSCAPSGPIWLSDKQVYTTSVRLSVSIANHTQHSTQDGTIAANRMTQAATHGEALEEYRLRVCFVSEMLRGDAGSGLGCTQPSCLWKGEP